MSGQLFSCLRRTLLLVAAASVFVSVPVASAQETEVKAATKKIEDLYAKAKQLRAEGTLEKAEALEREIKTLKARIAEASKAKQRPKKLTVGQAKEVIQGLKAGAASMRVLGFAREAEKMERMAKDLALKLEKKSGGKEKEAAKKKVGANKEREEALRQLKIMRYAANGLAEAGREDSAALMQRSIRALEVGLEGRRDEEAQLIRERAPTLGQKVELLMFAASKLKEAGKKEQAGAVGSLGKQLLERFRAAQKRKAKSEGEGAKKRSEGAKKRSEDEKAVAEKQIEVMKIAMIALQEGNKKEFAEMMKRAIQARLVRLRGLKGGEADVVLEREPKRGYQIELLQVASKLWREFGDEKKAASVNQLAEELARQSREKRREE